MVGAPQDPAGIKTFFEIDETDGRRHRIRVLGVLRDTDVHPLIPILNSPPTCFVHHQVDRSQMLVLVSKHVVEAEDNLGVCEKEERTGNRNIVLIHKHKLELLRHQLAEFEKIVQCVRGQNAVTGLVLQEDLVERGVVLTVADGDLALANDPIDTLARGCIEVLRKILPVFQVNSMRNVMQLKTCLAVEHGVFVMLTVVPRIHDGRRNQIGISNTGLFTVVDECINDGESELEGDILRADRSVRGTHGRPKSPFLVYAAWKNTNKFSTVTEHQVMPVPFPFWMIVQEAMEVEHGTVVRTLNEGLPFVSVGGGIRMNGNCVWHGRFLMTKLTRYIWTTRFTHHCLELSMKKFFLVLVAAVMMSGAATVSAQSPSEAFGLGASLGWYNAGGHLVYAITPAVHVGTQFGLLISDGNTELTFAPYGKFLFKGTKELKPFVIGQFFISSSSVEGSSSTGLLFGGGAEYFITSNFGLFAQIAVLRLPFSPSGSKVSFGLATPAIGAEWFF